MHACADEETRWTVFSTIWYLAKQLRFYAVPPALRYVIYLGWRQVMGALYEAHKHIVLWRECSGQTGAASSSLTF